VEVCPSGNYQIGSWRGWESNPWGRVEKPVPRKPPKGAAWDAKRTQASGAPVREGSERRSLAGTARCPLTFTLFCELQDLCKSKASVSTVCTDRSDPLERAREPKHTQKSPPHPQAEDEKYIP